MQPAIIGLPLRGGDGDLDHRLQGDHPGIVPILVEAPGDLRHHGSQGQDIEIPEIERLIHVVVFIGHIAAPEDGQAAIDDEGLVVHAPIEAREIAQRANDLSQLAQGIQTQGAHRIVEADLDLGVIVQQGQKTGIGVEGDLVDDDPYPHPPFRRPQEALGGDLADVVLVPDEVLGIDGAAGLVGQHAPPQQGLLALVQEQETRLAGGLVADQASDLLAQRRGLGIGDGVGFSPARLRDSSRIAGLEAGASGQHQRQRQRKC